MFPVLINAEHAAIGFVKSSSESDECLANGKPIGVIGEGLKFGLTQMAVGINNGVDEDTIRTISYYLNVYMTCAPGDPSGACETTGSFYDSWIKWAGTGSECGYGRAMHDTDLTDANEGDATEGSDGRRLQKSVIVGGLGALLRAF